MFKKEEKKTHQRKHQLHNFSCGLISGLIQAIVFNPWDRALYLSVKESRSFININNFKQPFTGLLQSIFQRAISAGLYFPLEEYFMEYLSLLNNSNYNNNNNSNNNRNNNSNNNEQISRHWITLIAGNCAGAINGFALNPLTAIKYHTWGLEEHERENFYQTAKKLFHHGGLRPFFAGTLATVGRDMLFGGCFAVMRHGLLHHDDSLNKFLVNGFSGFMATLISSPLNYVRNMHYATDPSKCHDSAYVILSKLWKDSKQIQPTTMTSQLLYLQRQLRIGWGTARVACGMALGALVYDKCCHYVNTK